MRGVMVNRASVTVRFCATLHVIFKQCAHNFGEPLRDLYLLGAVVQPRQGNLVLTRDSQTKEKEASG